MSYLDVMTLLFSFFVVLFAYQKALTAKQAARAENVVQSAEAAAPFAKDHPGNAETTLPASSAVIKASKAVSSDTAAVPQPVRNAMETGPVAASEFKIYPAYPGSALALTGISRDSEDESRVIDPPAVRQEAEETSSPADRPDQPVQTIPETAWIAEADNVVTSFDKAFADASLEGTVEISAAGGEVRLEINDAILFDLASAELKPEGASVLDRLASVLDTQSGTIAVEGHTDDLPIATAKFQSNWELSTARASLVTRYLIAHGISPERLRAVGLADTQPRETNDTPEGRARNRRVSIVIFLPREDGVRI